MKRFFLLLAVWGAIGTLSGCVVAPVSDRGVYYQRTIPYEQPPSYYYEPAPSVEYVGPPLWPTFLWFGATWHWSEHRHAGPSPFHRGYRGGGRRH
ncbi:MAG: hypothetical protein K2Y10_13500 [Burkholderiaceae bacterium]|nr:hypothetical protein [Burkholderiaceae bacterium]